MEVWEGHFKVHSICLRYGAYQILLVIYCKSQTAWNKKTQQKPAIKQVVQYKLICFSDFILFHTISYYFIIVKLWNNVKQCVKLSFHELQSTFHRCNSHFISQKSAQTESRKSPFHNFDVFFSFHTISSYFILFHKLFHRSFHTISQFDLSESLLNTRR